MSLPHDKEVKEYNVPMRNYLEINSNKPIFSKKYELLVNIDPRREE